MSEEDKENILKANSDVLNMLHQMVAKDLINRIKGGEADIKDINAAIKFLKDNDVTADIEFNRPVAALEQEVTAVGELPFVEDEDE